MTRPKRRRFAVVYWLDACGSDTHDESPGLEQVSAGILLTCSRACVKLAQIDDVVDGDGVGPRDVLTIPRGMVRKVVRLVERSPAKRKTKTAARKAKP